MRIKCVLPLLAVLQICTAKTFRGGELSSSEMKELTNLMSDIRDDGDMAGMQIPAPPQSTMARREEGVRCRLGTKEYCPGEILFRIGEKQVKAKVCNGNGKFKTTRIGRSYREPERCQHRSTEYCSGEMLRGFMAWSFVQQCNNGKLELEAKNRRQMHRAMTRFHG